MTLIPPSTSSLQRFDAHLAFLTPSRSQCHEACIDQEVHGRTLQKMPYKARRSWKQASEDDYVLGPAKTFFSFGDKFGESLAGSQAPPSFWEVAGLPRKFPELPRKFLATSPEVLSLWNLTAIQRFPGSFPNFPGSSPNFPGSSGTSLEVSPFLWEA